MGLWSPLQTRVMDEIVLQFSRQGQTAKKSQENGSALTSYRFPYRAGHGLNPSTDGIGLDVSRRHTDWIENLYYIW